MGADIYGLMYHEVTDDPTSSGPQRPGARPYMLATAAFRAHLETIEATGLVPTLVADVDPTAPAPWLLLTFDDGGRSALHAADELGRRGWRGHFFIVTGWIGERTFLDGPAIRALRSMGHVIGSHSHSHPDIFRDLAPHEMRDEWRRSADALADLLGEPCLCASLPGGDGSPAAFESAAAAGIRFLFTSEPWRRVRTVNGCRVFGRLIMRAGLSPAHLAAYLGGRGWARALVARRLKDLARRGLGPLYRAHVRRTTRPWARAHDLTPP